jgi:phosphohistidine phosphatase SixA
MTLYLLRHGKAARQDPDGPRSLTPKGREDVARVAGRFKKAGLTLQNLWHSPKTRAIQTAEIFLKTLGNKQIQVEEKKQLKPEGDVRDIYDEINLNKEGESLLIVSHLPFIDELGSLLAQDSPEAVITFPTSGLVAFEKKNKTWRWLWSWDPQSL